MNIWSALGIEPTDDKSAIKRAYAQKLKTLHPEQNPGGYQSLREAYDCAMKQAGQGMAESETEGHSAQPETEEMKAAQHFMEQAAEIYQHYDKRIQPELWGQLLKSDVMWNMKLRQRVSPLLFAYLEEHRLLPQEVWKLLDDIFEWSKQANEDEAFNTRFSSEWIAYYKQAVMTPGLPYTSLPDTIEREAFLSHREAGYRALLNGDLAAAGEAAAAAGNLYAEDPVTLRMQGQVLQLAGKMEEAVIRYKRLIGLQPEEMEGYIQLGQTLYHSGRVDEANQLCGEILTRWPQQIDAQLLKARCYRAQGDLEMAKRTLEHASELYPQDAQIPILLLETNIQLEERIKQQREGDWKAQLKAVHEDIAKPGFGTQVKHFFGFIWRRSVYWLLLLILFLRWTNSLFIDQTGFSLFAYFPKAIGSVGGDVPGLTLRIYIHLTVLLFVCWKIARNIGYAYKAVRH